MGSGNFKFRTKEEKIADCIAARAAFLQCFDDNDEKLVFWVDGKFYEPCLELYKAYKWACPTETFDVRKKHPLK